MRRRAPAVLLVLLVPLAAARVRAEPMQPIPHSVPQALAAMESVGPAPAELPLEHVTVFLGLRDHEALEAVIAAQQDARSPRFGRWLEMGEIADRFGPRREQYERVRRWFVGEGFRVVRESPARIAFVVAGTAGLAERALAAPIHLFSHRGRTYHGPTADPFLPESLAAGVTGILGLDDLPKFRPLATAPRAISTCPDASGDLVPCTALAPVDFAAAYAIDALRAEGLTGAGRQIAVIARSDFNESDVTDFAAHFGAEVRFTRDFVGDSPGILPGVGEETEVLIDTQWAGALAPGAHVNVIISTPQGDIDESLAEAVEKRIGDVVSISFGACEPAAPLIAIQLFDAYYTIANAQGQTVLVASGDGGATECGIGDRLLAVNALASSPHAIAVGGTSFNLLPDGALPTPVVERVWDDRFGGSGGGESIIFARPRYQLAALPAVRQGRALPDLALAGSPNTPGYFIVQGGSDVKVGGTSVGAPAFASVLALLLEHVARTQGTSGFGQLLPTLYRLGAEQARGVRAPVFRDVTQGDNAVAGSGGFTAGPGFDLATGWGAPMGDALGAALTGPGPCEPDIACLVPGRGPRRKACHAEWLVERGSLARRANDVPRARQSCRDGDPECDADGVADGRCVANVALCVNVFDYREPFLGRQNLPVCEPTLLRRARLSRTPGARRDAQTAASRRALQAAVRALPLPGNLEGACTATVPVEVPIPEGRRRGRLKIAARAARDSTATTARLTLQCEAGR